LFSNVIETPKFPWPRYTTIMDHDRLFKELIANFFIEFVELFLPDVSAYLDQDAVIFPLDKEVFTDITAGESHEADLIMRVKFKGQDAFFLIHVEAQASAQTTFPKRMFRYFARLHEKYDLPIYPVVIFSYDKPYRPEPTQYQVAFPRKTVLQFEYATIQLNRLPWRRFINQPNPVASALMAKMKMSPRDRPKVKLECLRMLVTLKLDPARSKLIGGFIDSYLNLTAVEMKRYEREIAKLAPAEQEKTMLLVSSWERRGIEQGIQQGIQQGTHQGKETLLMRQIQRRFGSIAAEVAGQIDALSSDQLDELGVALFDFASLGDLEAWLSHNQQH
jgi:hypothetical protein